MLRERPSLPWTLPASVGPMIDVFGAFLAAR